MSDLNELACRIDAELDAMADPTEKRPTGRPEDSGQQRLERLWDTFERLRGVFELDPWQVFSVNGPVNLSRLFNIYEQTQHPELKFKTFVPRELRLTASRPQM